MVSVSSLPSKLHLEHLSKSVTQLGTVAGEVEILRDLTLDIQQGEFVVILGPSGCGKSTLLNLLAGLSTPTTGTILLDGEQPGPPGHKRSVVFQDYALLPWKTAFENVFFALKNAPLTKQEKQRKTHEALSLVGLSHAADRYPHHLSGGMKQRVAIARSLVVEPEILLMDEPFAALDAQSRESLQEEMRSLWQRTQTTIIFITHDIDEALTLGERIIIMDAHPGMIKSDFRPTFQSCPGSQNIKASHAYINLRHEIRTALQPNGLPAS